MPRGVKKENLPSKVCPVCNRPFTWRKVWEKCWDDVVCCSDRCKNERKRQKRGAGKGDDSGGAGGAGGNSGASAALASFSFPYGAVPAPAWTSPRAALGSAPLVPNSATLLASLHRGIIQAVTRPAPVRLAPGAVLPRACMASWAASRRLV
mmetsp:Transcript_44008/g.131920  ORF Transcript_44008/g.131920 Transcript_44008/m.131920 type:complete len:151 (-) Transcript_44008:10-462(-)